MNVKFHVGGAAEGRDPGNEAEHEAAKESGPRCWETVGIYTPPWECTRPKGHAGDHVASTEEGKILAIWSDKAEPQGGIVETIGDWDQLQIAVPMRVIFSPSWLTLFIIIEDHESVPQLGVAQIEDEHDDNGDKTLVLWGDTSLEKLVNHFDCNTIDALGIWSQHQVREAHKVIAARCAETTHRSNMETLKRMISQYPDEARKLLGAIGQQNVQERLAALQEKAAELSKSVEAFLAESEAG